MSVQGHDYEIVNLALYPSSSLPHVAPARIYWIEASSGHGAGLRALQGFDPSLA